MAHNYIGLAHLAVAPRRKTHTAFCLINFTKPAANGRAQKQWQEQQGRGKRRRTSEKQTKYAAGHVNAIKMLPLCHAPTPSLTNFYSHFEQPTNKSSWLMQWTLQSQTHWLRPVY